MHVKLVCYGAWRARTPHPGSQLVRAHAVKKGEGVLKLSDKDMFNWAVDNSFFSCFTGRHSAALKSVVKGGRKGWVGVTCKEHEHTHRHTHRHTHNTCGPLGAREHEGEGSTSLIAPLIKKLVARRSTPIVS